MEREARLSFVLSAVEPEVAPARVGKWHEVLAQPKRTRACCWLEYQMDSACLRSQTSSIICILYRENLAVTLLHVSHVSRSKNFYSPNEALRERKQDP